jgi:hypothetical protein
VEPEIELGVRVYDQLRVWGNFNTFTANASSLGLKDPTAMQLYPLSAGLKYNVEIIESLDLYLGIGPTFTCLEMEDYSPYVQQNTFRTSWGVVGKSGLIYRFGPHVFFDFFADYYYGKIAPVSQSGIESESLNVGGLRTGLGIGMVF